MWLLFLPLRNHRYVYIKQSLLIYFFECIWVNAINNYLRSIWPYLLKCLWALLLNYGYDLSKLLLSYLFESLVESIFFALWNFLWFLFGNRFFDHCTFGLSWFYFLLLRSICSLYLCSWKNRLTFYVFRYFTGWNYYLDVREIVFDHFLVGSFHFIS